MNSNLFASTLDNPTRLYSSKARHALQSKAHASLAYHILSFPHKIQINNLKKNKKQLLLFVSIYLSDIWLNYSFKKFMLDK